VVSTINSPLHKLAVYIHNIIKNNIKNSNSHLKDSYDLVKQLNNTQLHSTVKIASFDVVSLFTNIPLDLALNSINKRWTEIETNTTIPMKEFLIRINLVLNSTFFKFNNTIYKQIYGTPMGSPLSPIIAEIILRDIEEKAFDLSVHIPIYYRYVDDILIASAPEELDNILKVFNSLHDRINFTAEINNNNSINFLNLKITLGDNNKLILDLYSKPTASGRFLNFYSNHPTAHKKGVIFGMIDRIMCLSDNQFHKNNIINCIKILLNNSYPLKFIFNTIRTRMKYHLYKQKDQTANDI